MVKDVPDFPAFDRQRMWGKIDLLKLWRPTVDPRKPYPVGVPRPAGHPDTKAHP